MDLAQFFCFVLFCLPKTIILVWQTLDSSPVIPTHDRNKSVTENGSLFVCKNFCSVVFTRTDVLHLAGCMFSFQGIHLVIAPVFTLNQAALLILILTTATLCLNSPAELNGKRSDDPVGQIQSNLWRSEEMLCGGVGWAGLRCAIIWKRWAVEKDWFFFFFLIYSSSCSFPTLVHVCWFSAGIKYLNRDWGP